MMDLLRPMAELSVIFPAVLLAYLPMKAHLRMHPGRLAALMLPVLAAICVFCGLICYFLQINVVWMMIPAALFLLVAYVHTLNVTRWKSVSVLLAVWGVFSCLGSIANAINSMICPESCEPWFSLKASVIFMAMCWTFVALSIYPAIHFAGVLLNEKAFAQTWYVFWILPLMFIGVNLFMTPLHPGILQQGRIMQGYIILSLVLLILLLMFYALFYLMAVSLNNNYRLMRENQFLSMQQAQYDNLQAAIGETRRARHDMRHHFNALSSLADRGEWDTLREYLADVQQTIPVTELNLCNNHAADSVLSHYSIICKSNDIPFITKLDLPQDLPVPEMELCLVLSNLLENALEASLRTDAERRFISVQAYLHSRSVILLTVENAFDGRINKKGGIFQSSKRRGDGVGIESVRHISEKNGGYSRFRYDDGKFRADVMLRGGDVV